MPPLRFKRLFHSVFTKLLVIILAAGVAITLTVVVGFAIIRFHSITDLDRNMTQYARYLAQDIGDPPDFNRAERIARRTGMAIRFVHPEHGWQTAAFPAEPAPGWVWKRLKNTDIWTGHRRGQAFIRMHHAGGELIFITPRPNARHEDAGIILLAMAVALCGCLSVAYLFMRRVLRPLRTLKSGVEALGAGRLDHRLPKSGRDEFRDLSEAFNTMAERLCELLESKEQLLLDVSHELRSPLTRLRVQLEFIQDAETRQNLQADLKEMEAMVTTILEEARLRNTSAALRLEATDMAELLRSVATGFQNHPTGVVCEALTPITLQVDPAKMRIVFRNLMDNALKNTPGGGPPTVVSMTRSEELVCIIVADRGEGIAESALPHLFEPFYRTDASRSRKTGGFGLGLSLCKAVIEAHNGRIEITSRLGQGTRVTVVLPSAP